MVNVLENEIWILCYYLLQLYNLLEFAFAKKDILITEKDNQKLAQNTVNERKLASAAEFGRCKTMNWRLREQLLMTESRSFSSMP